MITCNITLYLYGKWMVSVSFIKIWPTLFILFLLVFHGLWGPRCYCFTTLLMHRCLKKTLGNVGWMEFSWKCGDTYISPEKVERQSGVFLLPHSGPSCNLSFDEDGPDMAEYTVNQRNQTDCLVNLTSTCWVGHKNDFAHHSTIKLKSTWKILYVTNHNLTPCS